MNKIDVNFLTYCKNGNIEKAKKIYDDKNNIIDINTAFKEYIYCNICTLPL
jgi:hypothetical protein